MSWNINGKTVTRQQVELLRRLSNGPAAIDEINGRLRGWGAAMTDKMREVADRIAGMIGGDDATERVADGLHAAADEAVRRVAEACANTSGKLRDPITPDTDDDRIARHVLDCLTLELLAERTVPSPPRIKVERTVCQRCGAEQNTVRPWKNIPSCVKCKMPVLEIEIRDQRELTEPTVPLRDGEGAAKPEVFRADSAQGGPVHRTEETPGQSGAAPAADCPDCLTAWDHIKGSWECAAKARAEIARLRAENERDHKIAEAARKMVAWLETNHPKLVESMLKESERDHA